jgi:hypothetical protein
MCKYAVDGKEYTVGEITDYTAEVIQWDGDEQAWNEFVVREYPDTVGDAIERAREKHQFGN